MVNKKDEHRQKQKNTSGTSGGQKRKAVGALPSKSKKKRIVRRISSGNSEAGPHEGTSSKTPTFRQPQRGTQSSLDPPHPAPGPSRSRVPAVDVQRSHAGASVNLDVDGEEAPIDVNDVDDGGEESDEEGGEGGALTQYMQRLPESQRYVALGKAFTLRFWPWSDPNWWVDGGDDNRNSEESDNPDEGWVQFIGYTKALSIPESEWMTPSFRRSVTIPFCVLELKLTIFH